MNSETQLATVIELLASIAASLAEIASHTERERPEAPNFQRPIDQYPTFSWDSIEATVVRSDEYGPTHIEWDGRLWTRRSPENKFGEAIWFSRTSGKDTDGNNRYLRLITFKKVSEAEPLSRGAERMVRTAGAAATPPPATPAPVSGPPHAAPALDMDQDFDGLPSAAAQVKEPPTRPAKPFISPGAAPGHVPPIVQQPFLSDGCPHCGQSIQHENPACARHQAPHIGFPLPASAAPTGRIAAAAVLTAGKTTGVFRNWAADFARRYPKYRINTKTDDADMYHILRTVGSFGIDKISEANLAEVQERLEAHAQAA